MKNALWLAVFVFLPPLLVMGLARAFVQFPIGKLLPAVILLVLPVYVLVLAAIHRFSVERNNGEAELKAAFLYAATVAERDLETATEVADLAAAGEFRPVLRTNGIGMPGVAIGHFRLRNGRSGLLFVQDTRRPVLLVGPSTGGEWVLVNRHLVSEHGDHRHAKP